MVSRVFYSNSRWLAALLAVLVVTSGASGLVAAQSEQPEWAESAYEEFSGMVDVYNEAITSVDLGVAGDQLSGEKVNLVVNDVDGASATFSFELDSELRMTELDQGPRDDATLRMSMDRETFNGILTAENPAIEFRDAVANGDIRFTGVGTTNAVKWTVINTVADLGRMLGLF